MGDDDEIHLHVTYASHMDMDEAFCACMRIAIAAGLENVPIGVVTTPERKALNTFQQTLDRPPPRQAIRTFSCVYYRGGLCLRGL